ncbi:MAG: hypothetical protein ACE5KD_02775 [Candidatus Bathyarchaeia archaeon]
MIGIMKKLQTVRFDMQARIVITIVFLIVALIVTTVGVLVFKIEVSEAREIKKEIRSEFDRFDDPRFIFGNNLLHTLIMFVPVIGPIWGNFVLFNTGTIIAVFGIADGVPPILYFLLFFLLPFFWLEFGVYSVAMAQSIILFLQMLRHRGRKEAIRTCILVTVCAVILLLSAIVEWIMIKMSLG